MERSKINVCYISFNQLSAQGAVNKLVDDLYDGLNDDPGFNAFIMAEKIHKATSGVKNKDRVIYSFKTVGGRFRSISIIVNLFLKLFLLTKKPNIIHLHQMAPQYFIPLFYYARLFSVPIVITNHNICMCTDLLTTLNRCTFFKGKSISEIYENTYFVCMSKEIVKVINDQGISDTKLFYIPNGIEPGPYKERERLEKRVIWIGRNDYFKNIPLLIDVATKLKNANVRLDVFGLSEDELSIEEKTKIVGIKDYFHLNGYVENVCDELETADCLLVTSIEEGNSLAILEALSCGVPVLSTPVSAAREVLTDHDCGIVVDDPTAENLANAVKDLLSDKALWKKMSHNAVKAISEFYTTEIMVEAHKKMYREIISRRHGLAGH